MRRRKRASIFSAASFSLGGGRDGGFPVKNFVAAAFFAISPLPPQLLVSYIVKKEGRGGSDMSSPSSSQSRLLFLPLPLLAAAATL